jgi:hypothetical protein
MDIACLTGEGRWRGYYGIGEGNYRKKQSPSLRKSSKIIHK